MMDVLFDPDSDRIPFTPEVKSMGIYWEIAGKLKGLSDCMGHGSPAVR